MNAVALYALTRYVEAYGTDNSAYDMLISGLDYLALLKSTNGPGEGLYEGGREVNSDRVVESISWHSTEHNTDAWHVLYRAGMVLEDDNLLDQAADLSEVIIEKLWSEEEGRFYQGLNDDNYALDTASWGSIFLAAVGEHEKAIKSANNTERYKHTSAFATGYTPYDRADSVPTVWYEGTYGVVSAYRSLGDMESASRVVEESIPGQRGNGGFPYADDEDTINGRTTASSVASTAWFVLSTKYPEGIWSECVYKEEFTPPIKEPNLPPVQGPVKPPVEKPNLPPAQGPGKPPAVKNPPTAPSNVATPVAPWPHHAPAKGVSASAVYGSDDYGYESTVANSEAQNSSEEELVPTYSTRNKPDNVENNSTSNKDIRHEDDQRKSEPKSGEISTNAILGGAAAFAGVISIGILTYILLRRTQS